MAHVWHINTTAQNILHRTATATNYRHRPTRERTTLALVTGTTESNPICSLQASKQPHHPSRFHETQINAKNTFQRSFYTSLCTPNAYTTKNPPEKQKTVSPEKQKTVSHVCYKPTCTASPQWIVVRDFFGDRVLPVPNPILVVLLLPIRLLIPLFLLLLLLLLARRRSDDEGGRRSEDWGHRRRGEDGARVANG